MSGLWDRRTKESVAMAGKAANLAGSESKTSLSGAGTTRTATRAMHERIVLLACRIYTTFSPMATAQKGGNLGIEDSDTVQKKWFHSSRIARSAKDG